ncbi:MAG: anthranilate phosphoribosyltransferase [Candidatus Bipolaricaulia bacterium]
MMKQAIATLADGDDLSYEVAKAVMDELMSGGCSEAQIGAFLMGLRAKGETVNEITAFAEVMRAQSVRLRPNLEDTSLVDVCGTGGAQHKTFNVSTISALVIAGAGCPVAKHGNRGVTSPCGSADLLEVLGVNLDVDPAVVETMIEEIGIGFLFARNLHPAMKYAAGPRQALGIRTVFNMLGPLTNPAGATAHLMGVFSPALVEIYPEVLNRLGVARALVVHGVDGIDEISTVGPTQVGELRDGRIDYYQIKPEDYSFQRTSIDRVAGLDPEASAALARRLLHGELKDERYEMVLLNAGAGIYVANGADSIAAGIEQAEESIQSGAAYDKLEALIAKTQGT